MPNRAYPPPPGRTASGLRLSAVPALNDNYIWVVADASGAAVAVDPGEAAPLQRHLEAAGLHLAAILLTHHHHDHTGGAAALAAATGATVYAPHDERIALECRRVAEGDVLALAAPALRLEVMDVPAHTRSHIAFHGDGVLFCGDTLFSIGCGRLFEGTPAQMLAALERFAALPADTLVCCGHEYTLDNCAFAATVDGANPALTERQRQAAALRAAGLPSLPSTIAMERAANPFLRIDEPALVDALGEPDRVARFAELRRRKDHFRAPQP